MYVKQYTFMSIVIYVYCQHQILKRNSNNSYYWWVVTRFSLPPAKLFASPPPPHKDSITSPDWKTVNIYWTVDEIGLFSTRRFCHSQYKIGVRQCFLNKINMLYMFTSELGKRIKKKRLKKSLCTFNQSKVSISSSKTKTMYLEAKSLYPEAIMPSFCIAS